MAWTIPDAMSWPDALTCRERALSWLPDFQSQASPPALDGTRQFGSSSGGGLWRCSLTAVQLRVPQHVQAWLAFEVALRGGMTPIDVPLFLGGQPRPIIGATALITAVGGWAARAISGRVDLEDATGLEPGQHFADYDATLYGWRLHRIETVEFATSGGSGAPASYRDIVFWPPARFAVADNHALEIDNPRCVMRLAGSGSTDLDLELRKRGNPNAEFVECS